MGITWAALALLTASAAYQAFRPEGELPSERVQNIRTGMTRAEAHAALGPPADYCRDAELRSSAGRGIVRAIRVEVLMTLTLDVDLPEGLAQFRLPAAVAARLQQLLDRQDSGQPLTAEERAEAEGLVNLSEFLTLLKLRSGRASS
jgi:hypothetical protein